LRLLDIAIGEKNTDSAARAIAELDKFRPDDVRVQRKLAEALNAQKKHAEALVKIRKAKKADPDDTTLDVDIALTMFWSGQYVQALEQFDQLLTARGYDARLAEGYIDAAAVAEPFNAAAHCKKVLAIYEKMKQGNPTPAQLRQLAWVLRRVKENKEAV